MDKRLRVLGVEDSPDDTELLIWELRRGGYDPVFKRVETAADMKAALAQETWDIVLADYSMPHFSGTGALELLKETGLDIPFIFVSGTIGEDTAVEAMKNGASDYLLKGNLQRLIPALQRELREAEVRRERRQAEEEIRKLSQAVEQSPSIVMITDTEGRIEYVNPRFTEITGFTLEEVIRKEATVLGDQSPEGAQQKWQTIRSGEVWQGVFRNHKKGGEYYWESASISPVRDKEGNITKFVKVAEDITEKKRAEEQIHRQIEHLSALRAIDQAIAGSLDLRVTLSVLLEHVVTQLKVDAAGVLLLNRATNLLEYAAGRGFRTGAITRAPLRLGEGISGRAALERRMITVPDLREPGVGFVRTALLKEDGFIFHATSPLIAKGEVKGVLEVFHRTPFEPDDEWINFLEILAGQAAIAIDNAVTFDNLQRSNFELAMAYDNTLEGWSRALDLRDKETEGHTERVTEMTVRLAQRMGMREEELVHVRRGAILHDIGKMGIADSILLKPGPLTEKEWEIMRKHPVYAYELLSPIAYLRPALDIPYCHHEKWDGGGYPRGLKREEIPLAARIFAIMDVWDALRSDRPYRKAWSEEKALKYIKEQAGKHFDPDLVPIFLQIVEGESTWAEPVKGE